MTYATRSPSRLSDALATGPLSKTLVGALAAGVFATVAFDIAGQALSPLLGFARLAPVELAKSTLQAVFGAAPGGAGELLHFLTGLVAYPLGWVLVARPLKRRIAPNMPDMLAAAAYGVGLWIFALFFAAHLIAGLPAFLNFSQIAWVALFGHVVYAVVLVAALNHRR